MLYGPDSFAGFNRCMMSSTSLAVQGYKKVDCGYIYNVPKKRECFKLFQFYSLLMLHGAYRFRIRSFLKV